jgi:hypothetical protein
MRRMLESITERVTGFVAQRDDLAMVVRATAETGPAFLQVLGPVAESSEAGLFFTYDDEFDDPTAYVNAVVKAFAVMHDGVRGVMELEKMKPWPPLPPVVGEEGLPAVLRMRELMTFSRSLLPQPDAQVVVWTLVPKRVAAPARYAAFVRELLAHEWPMPWCHHMRVMVRDDPADNALRKVLEKAPRVQWYEPPLGPEAYQKGFEDAANDPTLPVAERMQSLLVAAGTDCSMGRHAAAREKYEVLVWYFLNSKALLPAALALNGLGEVHARTGNPDEAGPLFEQAMALATDGPVPSVPIMFTAAWNLGRLRLDQGRADEAATYFDVAQQCGAVLRSADLKLMAMEQHGMALLAAGKQTEADTLWEAGATVGDKLGLKEHRDAALRQLQLSHAADPAKVLELDRRMTAEVTGPPPEVPASPAVPTLPTVSKPPGVPDVPR